MTSLRQIFSTAVLALAATASLRAQTTISTPVVAVTQPDRADTLDLYAGGSENRFNLLRETKSASGYQFGARAWCCSWFGVEAGCTDFGSVKGSFPAEPVYTYSGMIPYYIIPYSGTNTFHVSARAAYVLAVVRVSLGRRLGAWLAFGPERFESKIGSDLYTVGNSNVPTEVSPYGLEANYSETRRSWTALGKAGLHLTLNSRWAVETEFHLTGAPAISNPDMYPTADIGHRRLTIWGGGLSVVCQLGRLH